MRNEKSKLFFEGVLFDVIGMASMLIPVAGPFLDILWAPYASSLMLKMYPNKQGKIAAVIVFIEEILPYSDIIPTFTLMWLYTFVWKKKPVYREGNPIEVESETL